MKQITNQCKSIIKIFITSQNNTNIFVQLLAIEKIWIDSDDVRGDMKLFVRHHVTLTVQNQMLLNSYVSNDLHAHMIKTLLDHAKDM